VLLIGAGCARQSFETGQLTAPDKARQWREGLDVAFDDRYTATPVRMEGRASHDVLDQRLLSARLGHSDLVVRVVVEEVWSRGRFKGKAQQYVDTRFDSVLLGKLPTKTSRYQRIKVSAADDLPPNLPGADLLLFVRWAPGASPSYRHHLMPASEEILLLIDAMVAHAQDNGVVFDGEAASKRKRRRRQRKQEKRAREADEKNISASVQTP
jgi:hypothetical protein